MCAGSVYQDGEARLSQQRWKRHEKARRCLTGVRKVTWEMPAWDNEELNIDVHVHSDWEQGLERQPTSGGIVLINGTVVKHLSR